MRSRLTAVLPLAFVAFICISCGGLVDPSQNQTDTISGTLQPGSARAHPFKASATGELTVKLGNLSPASQPYIGVQWVQAAGDGTCNGGIMQANQFAPANTTAITAQIVSGNYCIIVYDSVGLTQPENYTGTISHP